MTDDVVDFTDDIRVPRIDSTTNGYPIDHDKVVSGGKTYYRQRTSAPDGSNATMGAIADAAVVTDASGTLSAKLRGMVKILADVWDDAGNWLRTKSYLHDSSGTGLTAISDPGVGNALFTISEPVGWQIAEGGVTGHESYTGFGYDSAIPTTITDVSGRSANVTVPTTAILMEVVSSSANDAGTIITSGTATGGTTTTLIDTGKNFITLGVLAGDYVLNDTDVSLGFVVTVDSATQLTIQPVAETIYALKAYRIVRAASTGAAVVEHHGLDTDWNENSEFYVLNGLTPVSGTKLTRRSNNFHAMTVGTAGAPVGNISLRDDATGTIIYNYIQAGLNMSLQAHYTVPNGKMMLLTSWHSGSVGNKSTRALLRGTADFHDRALIPGVFHVNDVIMTSNGDVQHRFDLPKRFPGKCDVKISAATIGAGTSEVGCGFEFWIEDVA